MTRRRRAFYDYGACGVERGESVPLGSNGPRCTTTSRSWGWGAVTLMSRCAFFEDDPGPGYPRRFGAYPCASIHSASETGSAHKPDPTTGSVFDVCL